MQISKQNYRIAPDTLAWLGALMLLGIVVRVMLLLAYEPQQFPDTGTYLQAARDLVSGDFSMGLARRTPGYPLLIVLVGEAPRALMLAQMLIGLTTAVALFGITRSLTSSNALAFAVGASYHLNLQQLFTEATLITESLSSFSIAAVMWAFLLAMRRLHEGRGGPAMLVAVSLLSAFALMVRPQFLFLPLLLPALAMYALTGWARPTWRSVGAAAWLALPAIAVILAWCAVVQAKVGPFAMSTQSGFGLVNHVTDYIEMAPDRYAVARDVLVKTRDARIQEVGHSRNTIWYAWPDIQRVTGWTLPEASRQLQRMCTEMIVAQPARYALSVASAWVDFWTVPNFWRTEAIHPAGLATVLQRVWWGEHLLLRLGNLAFVLMVVAVLVSGAARRRLQWDVGMTAMAATVLASSLIQALADQGASSRYHLPTQPIVVLMLALAWSRARGARSVTHSVPVSTRPTPTKAA